MLPWWGVVLIDIAALGTALIIFALFHHVIPRKGEAKAVVVSMDSIAPVSIPANNALPSSTPSPSSMPAPSPGYMPGDFSATFPNEDTGANALQSYQSDNVRIAVCLVRDEENRITSYVADIWLRNIRFLKTAFAKNEYGRGILEWPIDIAANNGALLAVTGDYYGARDRGVVIRNGVFYRDEPYRDVCVLFANGEMETYSKEDFDVQSVIERNAYQAWGFGPALLQEGMSITNFEADEKLNKKNPRCGIGYYEPGHYCLVLVDGRQGSYSKGMTLTEFSQFFFDLGCKSAYNLDGGKTSAMIYRDAIVNKPFEDGRTVSDIIYISEEAQ